jgi:hypothetical protein
MPQLRRNPADTPPVLSRLFNVVLTSYVQITRGIETVALLIYSEPLPSTSVAIFSSLHTDIRIEKSILICRAGELWQV